MNADIAVISGPRFIVRPNGCKEENKTHVSIEFMHSSVEQERQAVISKLIARFEKENPGITVKQVPVEEDAYNTK
ncbi:hypothetical protein D3822_30500, partial [Escherichia coli]